MIGRHDPEPPPRGYVLASDGLLARDSGGWSQNKLDFLARYAKPAIGATKKKRGLTHYVDLFAGTGKNVCINRATGVVIAEFPGSPIIALQAAFTTREGEELHFKHFHFCNKIRRDHEALKKRVARKLRVLGGRVDKENVRFYYGDANTKLSDILNQIPPRAYVLVFADIEGPSNLAFSTVEELKRRHKSVDLYMLFPTGWMDRLLAYDAEELAKFSELWSTFFGTDRWKRIVLRRQTPHQARPMREELRQLYVGQLRKYWKNAGVLFAVRKRIESKKALYHMLFAHDHEAAGSIAESARKGSSVGQGDLFEQDQG